MAVVPPRGVLPLLASPLCAVRWVTYHIIEPESQMMKSRALTGMPCEAVVGRLWVGCGSVVGWLWVGCEAVAGRLWVGCGSVAGRLRVGCGSVAGRLWVGCAEQIMRVLQGRGWCMPGLSMGHGAVMHANKAVWTDST